MAANRNQKPNNTGDVIKGNFKNAADTISSYAETNVDMNLVFIVLFLVGFGLLMVYSASSYVALRDFGRSNYYFKKQITADLLGLLCMAVTIFLPLKKIPEIPHVKKILYSVAIGVVFMVIPFGFESHGARRWIQVPFIGLNLQPAEITKLFMILFLAAMINALGNAVISSWKGFLMCMGLSGVASILIYAITDNLSSALIVFMIAFVMCFVASQDIKKYILFIMLGLAAAGGVVAYVASSDAASNGNFRLTRISSWLHPENSAETSAHQMLQGLYAIGNGGWFGRGLGQSVQKISVLPEPQNDMIFAVICEELGIVGAISLMIMFALMIYRMLIIAKNARDRFSFLVVSGVMAHFAIQILLNIAVVTGSIPNTGVSLPFISYGGSSALFLLIEVGLVLNVDRATRAESREH
ncbi:MAG: putative lipid II flippase FtsW [Lachnospiraceae bacterium]|nr:putative lipid II flippase FtsW [Lachnospiraceae bacterium]